MYGFLTLALTKALLQDKVDLELPAAPLAVQLPLIGKQVGLELQASGPVGTDLAVIYTNGLSTKELLATIAKDAQAEWLQEGTKFKLLRPEAVLKKWKADDLAIQVKALDEGFKRVKLPEDYSLNQVETQVKAAYKVLAEGPDNDIWNKLQKFTPFNPSFRLLSRLAPQLNPFDVASLDTETHATYELSPTKSEYSMPGTVDQLLRVFASENETRKQAMQNVPDPGLENMYYSPFTQNDPNQAAPTTLVMDVTHQDGSGQFQMYMFDTQGNQVGSDNLSVSPYWSQFDDPEAPQPKPEPPRKELNIDYTPPAFGLELVKALHQYGEGKMVSPGKEVLDFLADPVNNIPEKFGISDAIIAGAKALGKNVFAILPSDSYYTTLPFYPGQKSWKLNDMLVQMKGVNGAGYSEDERWIHYAPSNRWREYLSRVPKAMLRDAIKEIWSTGTLSLDTVAGEVDSLDVTAFQNLITEAFCAANRASLANGYYQNSYDLLRVYNRLDSGTRTRMSSGPVNLDAGTQPGGLGDAIRHLVLFSGKYLSKTTDGNQPQAVMLGGQDDEDSYVWPQGVDQFPTHSLGNGFPSGSTMTIQRGSKEMLLCHMEQDQWSYDQRMSADQIGQQMALMEIAKKQGAQYYSNNITGYAMTEDNSLKATFQFGKKYTMTATYHMPGSKSEINFAPLTAMPQKVQDDIKAAYKKALEMYKDIQFGGPNQNPRPKKP